jgi:hypothetical protein
VLENLSEIEVVTVASLVYRTVLYICCVFVIITAVLCIFVLHRIAGPLDEIKNKLRSY